MTTKNSANSSSSALSGDGGGQVIADNEKAAEVRLAKRGHVPGSLYVVYDVHAFTYFLEGSPKNRPGHRAPIISNGTVLMFLRHPVDAELVGGLCNPKLWGLFLLEEDMVLVALHKLEPVSSPLVKHLHLQSE